MLGPIVSSLGWVDYFRHPFFGDYFLNLRFNLRDELPLRFEGNALPTAVNGSLWTIPLELKCYAVLAALGVAGLLRSRWILVTLLSTLALAFASWHLVEKMALRLKPRKPRVAAYRAAEITPPPRQTSPS